MKSHDIIFIIVLFILLGCSGPAVKSYRIPTQSTPRNILLHNGDVVVQTWDNLIEVQSGDKFINHTLGKIELSTSSQGYPVVIINDKLFKITNGLLISILQLPITDIVMTGGKDYIYLGGKLPSGKYLLFIYDFIKGYQPILELPMEIDSITVSDNRVYFSLSSELFTFKPGDDLIPIATLPGFSKISHITVDSVNGILYFSDGLATYSLDLDKGLITLLFRDAAGPMILNEDSLYILLTSEKAIYKVEGLVEALTGDDAAIFELR